MMNDIFDKYIKIIEINNNETTTKKINTIIVNSLPLILTEECGQVSSQIITDLVSKRNQPKNEVKSIDDLRTSFYNFLSKSLPFHKQLISFHFLLKR